ncbi:MAG: alpha/beta fold hydrolase [Alphaproteobacteria bacterium]|nr:alpha/beta fold hydrolase [Alphaproteobacteria bacterium]MBU2083822.1 alpha/beta fold hydrolase [Alphaproteobacteria bacterium]MBU2141760.1 alpha/beta fold hydrolase [Alphaproteobacteria bacterium]MBU2197114.1 alpha/beta fold hydrolase [Alphaproteobacteria bacterium]
MKTMIRITAASLSGLILVAACASAPTLAADPAPAFDADFPPSLVELNFESHGDRLNGHAYLANGPGPHPTVVLLHGFPGNERNLDLAQDLRSDGFNVLFFHYRGAWGSAGTYTLTHVIEDVAAATDYLRANAETLRTDPEKLILVGHSMGGFAALEAAARDETIACVAGIAPANMGGSAEVFAANPEAAAGFAAYADTMQMLSGLTGENAIAEIEANREAFDTRLLAPKLVEKSVLIIGGDKDTSVTVERVIDPLVAAYEAEPGIDLTAKVLSGDHSFSWSRQELIDEVIEWAEDCR